MVLAIRTRRAMKYRCNEIQCRHSVPDSACNFQWPCWHVLEALLSNLLSSTSRLCPSWHGLCRWRLIADVCDAPPLSNECYEIVDQRNKIAMYIYINCIMGIYGLIWPPYPAILWQYCCENGSYGHSIAIFGNIWTPMLP